MCFQHMYILTFIFSVLSVLISLILIWGRGESYQFQVFGASIVSSQCVCLFLDDVTFKELIQDPASKSDTSINNMCLKAPCFPARPCVKPAKFIYIR